MPEAAWVAAAMGGVFGLLIGSFLNVVIYRLPKMLERQWASECAQLSGKDAPEADVAATKRYRYGKGNFQVHYALDRPPAWVLVCTALWPIMAMAGVMSYWRLRKAG